MSVSVPGRVVVIDNVEGEVSDTIRTFWEAGEGVTFFQNVPDSDRMPSNVRALILDIALSGEEFREDEDIPQLALVLRRLVSKTKLCFVALWSKHTTEDGEDFAAMIRDEYRSQTGMDIPRTILFKSFVKKAITQEMLADEIRGWINGALDAGIVLEWERLVERARDRAVSDVVSEGEIRTLVRSIRNECGEESLPREIASLFNKVLQRRTVDEEGMPVFKDCVRRLLDQGEPAGDILEWHRNLHYLSAYFEVPEHEHPWTGDVYRTDNTDPCEKFAVVVSPACDFAQNKVVLFKLIHGVRFRQIPSYEPAREDGIPSVVCKLGKKGANYRDRESVLKMLFGIGGSTLPGRFYVLHFLKENMSSGDHFHLLLDFQDVETREKIPENWRRICRIDVPWVGDILQKYAALSARIGTPDVPEQVRVKEMEGCKGE